ncbi:hypothetical protein RJ45_22980 [Photobacterium gaetbulicola]|uniref:Uncharacterized protein n=1 Tax=Photobacterium gaetbulicola TaxID=1295392 RepID=A0A0B9FWK3_9GAMM|nr:hypothetical protein [Photobacterium gaetbulicola]KHT60908.1 hypothetical protein RJ45_22980 [Photobacterium gaetbulicola]
MDAHLSNFSKVLWIAYIVVLFAIAHSLLACDSNKPISSEGKPESSASVDMGDKVEQATDKASRKTTPESMGTSTCDVFFGTLNSSQSSYKYLIFIAGGLLGGALSFAYRRKSEDAIAYYQRDIGLFYNFKFIPDSFLGAFAAIALSSVLTKAVGENSGSDNDNTLVLFTTSVLCGFFFKILLDSFYKKMEANLAVDKIQENEFFINRQGLKTEDHYFINRSLCFLNAGKIYSAMKVLEKIHIPTHKSLFVSSLCKLEYAIHYYNDFVLSGVDNVDEENTKDYNLKNKEHITESVKLLKSAFNDIVKSLELAKGSNDAQFGIVIRGINILVTKQLIESGTLELDNNGVYNNNLYNSKTNIKNGITYDLSGEVVDYIKSNDFVLDGYKTTNTFDAENYIKEEGKLVAMVLSKYEEPDSA